MTEEEFHAHLQAAYNQGFRDGRNHLLYPDIVMEENEEGVYIAVTTL